MKGNILFYILAVSIVLVFSSCKNPVAEPPEKSLNTTVNDKENKDNSDKSQDKKSDDTGNTSDGKIESSESDIKVYDIIYHNMEGINNLNNPSKYEAGTTVQLMSPIHKEYDFGGWYLKPDFSGKKISVLDNNIVHIIQDSGQGNVNSIKLYAKWIGKDKVSITINEISYKGFKYDINYSDLGNLINNDLTMPEDKIEIEKREAFNNLMYSQDGASPEFSKYFFINDLEKDYVIKNKMIEDGIKIIYTTILSDSYLIIHEYKNDEFATFCLYLKEPYSTKVTVKDCNEYETIKY